jgi:putative spermidine/putrescine transport system permease protein
MQEERHSPWSLGDLMLRLMVIVVSLFLILPVIIIVILSFNSGSFLTFPPTVYGLRWYARFLSDPEWRGSIIVSMQVAGLTALFATTLGFITSYALVRGNFKGKVFIYGFVLMPMIVPNIITAIDFYFAFGRLGASGSVLGIALGHTVIALPLVVVMLTATFQSLDKQYELAAWSLGAGYWYTMRRVTLPLAVGGVLSAALFAFLTSFDELLISLFLSGVRTQTLTVRMWNNLILEIQPTIASVSACLIALTIVILGINAFLGRRLS